VVTSVIHLGYTSGYTGRLCTLQGTQGGIYHRIHTGRHIPPYTHQGGYVRLYTHQGGYVHLLIYTREAYTTGYTHQGGIYHWLYPPGRLCTPCYTPGRLCTPLYTRFTVGHSPQTLLIPVSLLGIVLSLPLSPVSLLVMVLSLPLFPVSLLGYEKETRSSLSEQ